MSNALAIATVTAVLKNLLDNLVVDDSLVLAAPTPVKVSVGRTTILGAEDVALVSPTIRTASCIVVLGDPSRVGGLTATTVDRIAQNDLTVGRHQEGIVVVDMARVQVEDNTLTAIPTPTIFKLEALMRDLAIRANLRRLVLSQANVVVPKTSKAARPPTPQPQPTTGPPTSPTSPTAPFVKPDTPAPATPPAEPRPTRPDVPDQATAPTPHSQPQETVIAGSTPLSEPPVASPTTSVKPTSPITRVHGVAVRFNLGVGTVAFRSTKALAEVWELVLALPRLAVRPGETAIGRLHRAADTLLMDSSLRHQFPTAVSWWSGINRGWFSTPIPAAQGIVVGGSKVIDVRIRDKTLTAMAQGLHVGLSHRGAAQKLPEQELPACDTDIATNVMISGNTLTVVGSVALRAHEGIFVGNCDDFQIRENSLMALIPINQNAFHGDGIRVFGWIGRLAAINRNRLPNFNQPITFHHLGTAPTGATWINSENDSG